ncbi:hypothetical protein V2J09_014331 [Rumex salicifolius]
METFQGKKYPKTSEVVEEFKRITNIGIPIAAMSLLGYLKNMISVMCLGRLGGLELAGGALAIGFANITGYSVLSGLAMGMEPLCSQAFGSNNKPILALITQRTMLVLLIASLPIGCLWFNLDYIMITLLHQDPDIAHVASLYCLFSIPDLLVNAFLHPIRIYLRSQGTTWPLLWSTLLALLLDIPITILLPFKLNLGVKGVAVANFITNFNTLVFLISYIIYIRPKQHSLSSHKPLLPDSRPQAEQWGTLFKLAIPSCLAVCLEWWWYELMTLLAGYLKNPQVTLATSAIVIQTTSLMYTIPTALSASVSSRVGNELGAGRPHRARLATIVAISLALLSSVFGILWTTLGRESWGRLFANDNDEVLSLTSAVLPIIGICEIANCPQTTGCGALRGSARPGVGAAINLYSFYVIGTPIAIALAFGLKQGYIGLCYGLLAAQIACVLSILMVIYNTNWEWESSKAMEVVGFCESVDSVQILKCDEEGGFPI